MIGKIDNYLNEASKKAVPFTLASHPSKIVTKGKIQYFIRVEKLKTQQEVSGYIKSKNISALHKAFGKIGWIVTEWYEE